MELSIIIVTKDKEETDKLIKLINSFVNIEKEIIIADNDGVFNAIKSSSEKSTGRYNIIIPSDDIGVVFSIDKMFNKINEGYELVSATRYSKGGRRIGRYTLEKFLSTLTNKIIRRKQISDMTTGVVIFKKGLLKKIKIESDGWDFAFELKKKSIEKGITASEVPIISIDRFFGGNSSFRLSWIMNYIKILLK